MTSIKQPSVSVVVVNYNGKRHLKECFESLLNSHYPKEKLEILMVDNNSSDGSLDYVKKNFPNVRILSLDKDYGYAGGINRGVNAAKGEYLVLLTNDTVMEKGWLVELINVINDDKKIGACTPKILNYNKPNLLNCVGGFMSVFGVSGSLGENERENKYESISPVFFPSGCCFIIRKKLIEKIGKLDQDYFMYVEDTDVGWKLWDAGYKVLVVPKSRIYHKVNSNPKSSDYYFFNTRNRLITIIKNTTNLNLLPILGFSIICHYFQSIAFIITLKICNAFATLKGIVWVFLNLDKIIKKRNSWKIRTGRARKMMLNIEESIKIFYKKSTKHFI
jgi:GT2 family glycosyltransferase